MHPKILIILILLLGCSSGAQETYTNPHGKYSVVVPPGWEVRPPKSYAPGGLFMMRDLLFLTATKCSPETARSLIAQTEKGFADKGKPVFRSREIAIDGIHVSVLFWHASPHVSVSEQATDQLEAVFVKDDLGFVFSSNHLSSISERDLNEILGIMSSFKVAGSDARPSSPTAPNPEPEPSPSEEPLDF